ncbi:hypothetical protein [Pandoraea sp. PE-S2T-3]|uniref:hypothetical protein n=1 Tax=Pandoraea sp. PE-S2T-3 TaxID=1986993 RepID=UPI000B405380|nr:hypothetical protein [Pandoraea sp. PE-S2T-3]
MKLLVGFLGLLLYTVTSCLGLYFLKTSSSWVSVKFVCGGILYVAGAGMWIYILRIFPLSLAFPVASGLLMMGTTVTGYMLLNERLSMPQGAGILLILLGIAVIGITTGKT